DAPQYAANDPRVDAGRYDRRAPGPRHGSVSRVPLLRETRGTAGEEAIAQTDASRVRTVEIHPHGTADGYDPQVHVPDGADGRFPRVDPHPSPARKSRECRAGVHPCARV